MRGKGFIQFFAIALILVCIYQLSFNIVTSKVESRADDFADSKVLVGKTIESLLPADKSRRTIVEDSIIGELKKYRQQYLDSMSNETVYNLGFTSFTYQKCKEQQLNLGLDLQGGMNVVLQVSMRDLIVSLSDHNHDSTFVKALNLADKRESVESQKDYVTLFGEAYKELSPTGRLAAIFNTKDNADKIKFNSTNDEVLSVIKAQASDAFDRTYNILRSRIDKFGVTQPNITAQPSTGRVVVELPGVDNPQRVRKLLQASAKLEFWETYSAQEIYPYFERVNKVLATRLSASETSGNKESDTLKNEGSNPLLGDSSKTTQDSSTLLGGTVKTDSSELVKKQMEANPFFAHVYIPQYKDEKDGQQKIAPGPSVGIVLGKDTAKVNQFLSYDFVKSELPRDVKFLWGAKPYEGTQSSYVLYAIKMQAGEESAPLEGDAVVSARQDFDQNNRPEVSMNMSTEGGRIWKNLTAKNVNKSIAIVLDNYVQSAPNVINEIPNGRSSITGGFTIEEAKDLANILQAGKLPAPAKIIAEELVGPSLGEESIHAGIRSVIIAFIAILAFMVLYYNTSGIVANIALFLNLFFIIGVLASLSATLTLSGIAGIVLTMGMAVDANVLIHERIKEELEHGKTLIKAINDGHHRSYSAVFDTHLTTLLTGIILAYYGLGPVLGYATTLNIGIILTLFTAVFLAHLIMYWWVSKGRDMKFTTSLTPRKINHLNIQFVAKRKYAYVISGTLFTLALISIFTKGFDYGVDFKGGRSYVVRFEQPVNTSEVRAAIEKVQGEAPIVKTYGSSNKVKITSVYLIDKQDSRADSIASVALYDGVKGFLGPDVTYEKFREKNILTSQVVGPTISGDIRNSATKAIIFSLIGIFLYILVRFRKWQFALGAIIALAHDVVIMMGAYSFFSGLLPFTLEVDETFVAAALTVMGYSINDTVIVFDRIREFLREHPASDMKKMINDAINSTLSRTIMTSVTVLLVLLILFIFGGDVIRGFSFALLLGITFGVYSSVFVATPIVIDLTKDQEKLKSVAAPSKTQATTSVKN